MSWVAQISVERLFTLQVFGKSQSLSAKVLAMLGFAMIVRAGFDSPIAITLFRLIISYTLAGIFHHLGCRVFGNKFSITITAFTYLITAIGYWLFEIMVLPTIEATVIPKRWELCEINVIVTLVGISLISIAVMWTFGNLFGVMCLQDYSHTRERVVAVKELVDEIVTASRVQRMNSQQQLMIERTQAPSIYIRQNVAVYFVETLVRTTRSFKLTEREAADLRHRSDRWTEELEEENTYLSPDGLRQTQKFVTYIIQLNYLHRINNDAASLGESVQQEVMNWIQSVAQHPNNQLYIKQAQNIVRKYTTAATLSTLDGIFLPLPQGLEPVDNATYIKCLALYVAYVFTKDVSEIRVFTKYGLPLFFIYRYFVNRRGLHLEDESHPLINALTPRTFRFLFKLVGVISLLHITHSSRLKKVLPKIAQNSLLFTFLRFGTIPLYLTLRRYINANWELLE